MSVGTETNTVLYRLLAVLGSRNSYRPITGEARNGDLETLARRDPSVTEADDYVRHLEHNIFPAVRADGGLRLGVRSCGRRVAAGVGSASSPSWQSMESIRQFSGGERATWPWSRQVVQAMMVDFDKTVAHYEVVETFTPG